eukprot:TRINITY_DN72477_c0_g1_i1.p1 TRINITY_DN72477_c0_g1~~TRINITY_DN72477_c0_g1_i1.p1  ORF type:complete len:158 (-),score=32.77 TRINITY_DN72477_c0_g1_i1:182-655(-)
MSVQASHGSPKTQDGEAMDAALPRRNCYGVCQFMLQRGPDGQVRRIVQRLGLDEFGHEWDAQSWHSTAFSRQCSSDFSRQNTPGIHDDLSAAAMREILQAGAKQDEVVQAFPVDLHEESCFREKDIMSPKACTSGGYASGEEPAERASDDADTVEVD